ncbi:MAG: TetR/AcrR family transcriptional regulator [Anaerovorax sp.]|nr:TetR/AcrR family transcriptional regulator [Anaerovorax sp.]
MGNSTDLRVIKNKKHIKEAFLELIQKCDYEKITVTELAEKAMINRKTFYLHYETKDALLDEIIQDGLKIMLKNTRYPDLMPNKDYHLGSVENDILCILKNISSDKTLFKLLFSNNEMQKQTKTIIKDRLISIVLDNYSINSHIPEDLFSLAITAVAMEMFRWWLDQEECSEEETALIFIELLINGFTQLAK